MVGRGEGVGVSGLLGADEVGDGIDQGEVGQGLRVIAQVTAGDRVQCLGVEPER